MIQLRVFYYKILFWEIFTKDLRNKKAQLNECERKKVGGKINEEEKEHTCIDWNNSTILVIMGILLVLYFIYAKYYCNY